MEPSEQTESLTQGNIERYLSHTAAIWRNEDPDVAYARAIGSENVSDFIAFGQMEADLLRQSGLRDGHALVDVGCGSGRLSCALAPTFSGDYLGIDIDPRLVEVAERLTGREDWTFRQVDGLVIRVPDATIDMVCFFSVLTHLRHEESYLYLQDASRVLRPGGTIVFSFLDFAEPNHWAVFEATLAGLQSDGGLHVNQFISVDTIQAWAAHLGVDIVALHRGSEPYIELSAPILLDGGERRVEGNASLGQSACVLRVPDR